MPIALRHLDRGGVVVSAGIHMSDIPGFPYRDLGVNGDLFGRESNPA